MQHYCIDIAISGFAGHSSHDETSARVCADALHLNFKPKEELVSKIALSIASVRRASPAGYMTEAGNVLRETLRHVYDPASPMHSLVSEAPSDLELMSAASFVEWFEAERATERTVLTPITYCKSDEEKLNARPSNGGMPYSDIIHPQTLSVELPNDRLLKSGGLSHAVLVAQPPPAKFTAAVGRYRKILRSRKFIFNQFRKPVCCAH